MISKIPIIQALKTKLKKIESTLLYYVTCIVPATLAGYNINYLYIFQHGAKQHKKIHDKVLQTFIFFLPICYLLGLFTTIPLGANAVFRQFVSFVAFSLPCSLLFISYNDIDLKKVLDAVVLIALLYSLWVIAVVVINPGQWDMGVILFSFQAKGLLRPYVWAWPQYFAPVLVFSLLILLAKEKKKLIHYLLFVPITIVLYLTHTRAMYLALGIGLIAFVFVTLVRLLKQKKVFIVIAIVSTLILGLSILIVNFRSIPVIRIIIEYAELTIAPFRNIIQGNAMTNGSDIIRLFQWQTVFELIFRINPFSGTGFAGIYLFPEVHEAASRYIGGTDSQVLEAFLKMGVLGGGFTLYFFAKLVKYFFKTNLALCCAVISLFVYSFFHVTYGQSYLGFIFFFLLSYVDSKTTKQKARPNSGSSTGMKKIIYFDTWTEGIGNYLFVDAILKEKQYQTMLLHVESLVVPYFASDIDTTWYSGMEEQEISGVLCRDVSAYKGLQIAEILQKESPCLVLMLSLSHLQNRIVTTACHRLGIPVVYLMHGAIRTHDHAQLFVQDLKKVNKFKIALKMKKLRKFLVLIKEYYWASQNFADSFKIFMQLISSPFTFCWDPKEHDSLKVNKALVYTHRDRESLARTFKLSEEQIAVVGNPKLDSAIDYQTQDQKRGSPKRLLYLEEFMNSLGLLSDEQQEAMLNLLNEAALENGLNFAIRLHPGTNRSLFIEKFNKGYKFTESNVSLQDDLLSASIAVGQASTSMLEALSLRIPVITLAWYTGALEYILMDENDAGIVKDQSQLSAKVKEFVNRGWVQEETRKALFPRGDKKASECIIKEIEALIQ